ncbi:MAG TPA: RHS repeat-associated core domain-containing protein, partial [Thermoguttaceae bacterium]|nr:RHS repeat-associated core domain-containing protein [Thermoguttaceae bacterium]
EGGTDSLSTQFAYDDDATGNVFTDGGRLVTMTYPDGSTITHTYTTGVSDLLNRTKYLEDSSSAETVAYYHNGVGRPVRVKTLDTAPLMLDYYQGTSGTYAGFDRFGRVKDQRWVNWSPEPDVALVQIGHGYDLAGNRIYREDVQAAATSVDLDEFYTYDGLHRVKNLDRGALDEGKTAISGTPAWEEDWSLDELDNWNDYLQKTGGSTQLDQSRLHNKANEIDDDNNHANQPSGSITATTGTNWADPTHDAAGNMTTIPKQSPALAYTGVYDAWNRLVRLQSGQDPEAEYEYDGLNQLIVNKAYGSGQVSETRHYYYNDRWQCLEERLESDGTISSYADIRYVWGLRYVDELVLRQRDTDADGTLDETLYALQDANFNVVALAEPDGDVVERFTYNAYGQATQLDPDFTAYGGEDYLWDYLYTGRPVDRESGLMYYRNRFYHTGLGRFVTRDPIGYWAGPGASLPVGIEPEQVMWSVLIAAMRGVDDRVLTWVSMPSAHASWNLYQYAMSGPLDIIDPSGLMGRGRGWPDDCCDVLGSAGMNYSRDLALHLRRKINAYRGAGDHQDQNHFDNIQRDCEGLRRTLELIAECAGPRTMLAQAALDAARPILDAVMRQCNDPNLLAPRTSPSPAPEPNPGPILAPDANRVPVDDFIWDFTQRIPGYNPGALRPNNRPFGPGFGPIPMTPATGPAAVGGIGIVGGGAIVLGGAAAAPVVAPLLPAGAGAAAGSTTGTQVIPALAGAAL